MLHVRHPRHLAVLVAADLLRVAAVADGAAVERALDAIVSVGLCASSLVSPLVDRAAVRLVFISEKNTMMDTKTLMTS